MIEQDTVRLLRECDAGVKMGLDAIDQVLPHAQTGELRDCLAESRTEHEALDRRLQNLLDRCGDEGRSPTPWPRG